MLQIKVINKSNNPLPKYQTIASAGMDLHANLQKTITLQPGERKLIPTGLFIELPLGYEAQVRPRSGLALKHGITVLNSPGTIDADYRGEIKVLLVNHGTEEFEIEHSDRIAQMIIARHEQAEWIPVSEINQTDRGIGGYGSSGK